MKNKSTWICFVKQKLREDYVVLTICENRCLLSQQILLLHTLSCRACRKGKHDVTIFLGSVFYRKFCNEQNIFLSLFHNSLNPNLGKERGKLFRPPFLIIQNYSNTLLKSNAEIYIVKRDSLRLL